MIVSTVELGKEIRRRRKMAGLNQTELATSSGTTRHLISALEKGDRGVSIDTVAVVSELGLDLSLTPRS